MRRTRPTPETRCPASTALIVGSQLAVMAVNLTISVVVLAVTLRTTSPRRVASYCRETARTLRTPAAPQPAAPVAEP